MFAKLQHRFSRPLALRGTIFLLLASVSVSVQAGSGFNLKSPSFHDLERIPVQFTCIGANDSPDLIWAEVPADAKSLAVIVNDPDAPSGNFVHWVIYGIPPSERHLPVNAGKIPAPVPGAEQGVNDFGVSGYRGPCPPPGRIHHYHFQVFALDIDVNLPAGAAATALEQTMKGHIISKADLVGLYGR